MAGIDWVPCAQHLASRFPRRASTSFKTIKLTLPGSIAHVCVRLWPPAAPPNRRTQAGSEQDPSCPCAPRPLPTLAERGAPFRLLPCSRRKSSCISSQCHSHMLDPCPPTHHHHLRPVPHHQPRPTTPSQVARPVPPYTPDAPCARPSPRRYWRRTGEWAGVATRVGSPTPQSVSPATDRGF